MEIVRNFAPGAVKDIERNHGVVLDPLKTSLARLVAANRPFFRWIAGRDNPGFMNSVSRPTQVAFFPDPEQFYVPESNWKSLKAQGQLLKVDEAEVVRGKWGIGGMELIIGGVATHAGLVFAYFDQTGGKVRLHGEDYDYRYGGTETPMSSSGVGFVGHFDRFDGLRIGGRNRNGGLDYVWTIRLGVPAQE